MMMVPCLATVMNRVILGDYVAEGAMCLDGTPAVYYIHVGDVNINKWIIFFSGGGWCYNDNLCSDRSVTDLGSSSGYPPTYDPPESGNGIQSDDIARNPNFYNWNFVFVRYCDGASWAGYVEEQIHAGGRDFWYRGLLNYNAMIENLITVSNPSLSDATEVILTGCSAGGLGAFFHCDALSATLNPFGTAVTCLGNGNYFADLPTFITGSGTRNIIRSEYQSLMSIQDIQGGINQNCIAAQPTEDEWKCMFPQYFLQDIETPTYVINSAYDDWQISNIWLTSGFGDQPPPSTWSQCASTFVCSPSQETILYKYNNRTMEYMEVAWKPDILPQVGTFITQCFTHCLLNNHWTGPG